MDTARFIDDLIQTPDRLGDLAIVLDRGIEPVLNPGRILLLGMGSSMFAAQTAALEARSLGLSVVAELASTTLLPAPAPDLLVIAVSANGTSAEVLAAAERFLGGLVVVTNREDSPLAALGDRVVPLSAGPEESGVSCRSFRHTLLVLRALLGLRGAGELARSAAHANAAILDTRKDWLADLAEVMGGPDGTYVLGPADRFASVQQSALMIREVPRRTSFASETGDWAHIDVYLTKPLDYRALLLTGSAWDDQAVEWMTRRGSTLATVGSVHASAVATIDFPGSDDRLTAVLSELMVAELLAAHWLAVDDR